MLNFKESFYEKLFQSLDNNAVIMRVEPDGSYEPIWCTREFAEMMEGTVEECIRLENGSMSTVHPDDREEVAYLFRHHATKSGLNNLTIRKFTVTGRTIWVNLHFAFIEEDGVQYAYCNYTDVSEIKESQAKAEAMYQSTRADLASLSAGALSFLRVNLSKDDLEEISGSDPFTFDLSPGVDHVKEWQRFLPLESDRKRFAERISPEALINTFNSGIDHFTDQFFTQRKDGRKCFVRISENIRQDPATGDIISFFTEYDNNGEMVNQTILNKALVEQYDMITSLIDGDYSVVIGDPSRIQGGGIFPKETSGKYTDYLEDQVIPALVGTEKEKAAMAESLRYENVVAALEKSDAYEADIVCGVGDDMYYKRFVFYEVNREAKFYILLKSDITNVIREQQARNEILATALKGAQEANAAKTSFLSSMSHEIRTPMNAIIGLDSIALNDPDISEQTRDYLEKIDSSAKHLLGLINDILDMSRIESGRMTIKGEEFSFRSMLGQINTMIGGQCQDKGLTYDIDIREPLDDYYIGDDMKLKQVLINILGNAVKFTPEGGTVSFSTERTAQFDGKSTIRFVVADTGIGMDESFLPKIFEAFSQEDGGRSSKYGSAGLGMAITKSIVEMMNGNISVESEKGKGSTFTVDVTLKDCDQTDRPADQLMPQDMKVLVIDDDPVDCEHARLVLEEVGIAADTCTDSEEALRQIELHHARRDFYNLILVDWRMPDPDGLAVTKRIRELYDHETTIIILTAYNWDDIADEAREAGVDSFVAKPLFAGSVMDEFGEAFRKKHARLKDRKAELAGKRILLAEDVPVNAEIMTMVLSMRDMQADLAENGQIAVDLFAASEPGTYDAILMDMRMPVMDGLEAARTIRAMDRKDAKEVPIIALTANAFDEDVQRSLQAGLNAHLSKPVEPERLYETLESLIKD